MSHESSQSSSLPAGLVGVAVDFDPFASDAPVIERVIIPTDAQREVWLADHMSQEASLAYNEAVELSLKGPLDDAAIARLREACRAVFAAHQALRAVFSDDGSEMLMQTVSAAPLVFEVTDLRGQDATTRARRLSDWRQQVVSEPFDLGKGPLFRAHLLRMADDHGVLLLAAHHLVCDGYSFGLVLRDLARAFRGEALAPSSYTDYANNEDQFTSSADAGANVQYWTQQYQQDVPVTDLPTDHPRPARRQVAAGRIDHLVPANDFARLQQAARSLRISLFSFLLGGFELLISRLTGSADVVVGVPAAGQLAAELPDIVGHCVNLLPVRNRIDTKATSADWLAGVQRELLDAFEHQRFTFGTLLRHLALKRDPSRLPLVSVMFNLDQRLDPAMVSLDGFETHVTSVPRRFENFELFFNLTPVDEGLRIECQYSTALFDDASIHQWLQSYAALLLSMAEDPQRAVGAQAALSDAQQTLLAGWNDTGRPQSLNRTPVSLIDRIGPTQLRKLAVADARHQLSYRSLLDASHQLAERLQQQGVGPGSLVGLCLTRGVAMVVAQWAVWRAGAAYVPLDPHFPQDRLAYMAEDAALALVLADADTLEVCQAFQWPAEKTLTISAEEIIYDLPAEGAVETHLDRSQPEATAYVIYTSGSTGKPKGVAVPHRAAANLLLSMARRPGIRASDRLLAVTTLSFDIALLELVTPLIAGGTVYVADRDDTGDGYRLAERLSQWKISVMQATPGTWRLLLAADWKPSAGFRALVGGEPLPLDLARELTALPLTLWNMYGPTETTVWSTCWQVPPQPQHIRIGGPIDNTHIRIVDADGMDVPFGAAGEILIGGEGVAQGYLNRPELTGERFIPDTAAPGRRIYRTGDRGRWRHDGTLEHLGRLDHQVKVRGYRIELGEIEAVLGQFDGIAQVVTIVREDVPGDQRLVAYQVAAQPEATPREASRSEASALRAHLRKQLPDYMVPQHFVWLPAFTLLPNGKIDRKVLPRPDQLARGDATPPAAAAGTPGATPAADATAAGTVATADPAATADTPATAGATVTAGTSPAADTAWTTGPATTAAGIPSSHGAPSDYGYGAPAATTPDIHRVRQLMAEYLRLPDLHPDDDFFASGGHSLLAAQLLQALGREHGLKIPLATLFEAPTARQLADWLQSALASRAPVTGTQAHAVAPGTETGAHADTRHAAGAATMAFPADATPGAGHRPGAGPAFHDGAAPHDGTAPHAGTGSPAGSDALFIGSDILTRREDRQHAPLSLMQQRLYFLESITPGTPVYNTPSAHRLTGEMNEAAFQRAFDQLCQRQPILRTVIRTDDQGMPQQTVLDSLDVPLFPAVDLGNLSGQAQEEALREAIDSLAQEPIPLHSTPLFRTRMFRLAEDRHVWFFMPHHIIWDGWSFDLLYQEMARLYEHQLANPGADSPLPPLAVDYGDFALWHHRFLQSDALQQQVDHWLARLDPKLPPLDLPADRERPARMSGLGSTEWLYLPERLVARLREHARLQHSTPFMTLLSVWALLLHGLSGQPAVRIGTPVRGRELPELETIMGFFVNALPLTMRFEKPPVEDAAAAAAARVAPIGQTRTLVPATTSSAATAPRSPRELLEQVRALVIEAFGNSDVPADRLLQALGPTRDESRPPLWQAFFSFQEATARQLQWGNLHDQPLYVLQPGTAEDIGLWFLANGNHMVGGLQYNTDIFDALRVRQIAEAYQLLLTRWLDTPSDTPLAKLLACIPSSVLIGVSHADRADETPADGAGDTGSKAGARTATAAARPAKGAGSDTVRSDGHAHAGPGDAQTLGHVPGIGEDVGIEEDPATASERHAAQQTVHAGQVQSAHGSASGQTGDTGTASPAGSPAATAAPDTAEAPGTPAAAGGTEMEGILSEVWGDLLGTDDIRPDDNFFDLGGHSMLVMQAIARMEVRTGRRVNPRRFVFETLAQVARAYDEAPYASDQPDDSAGKKGGGLMSRMLGGLRKKK